MNILKKEFDKKISYTLYIDLELYELLKNTNYIELIIYKEIYF